MSAPSKTTEPDTSTRIDVQFAIDQEPGLPSMAQIQEWADASLPSAYKKSELCIRIVDRVESQQLNARFRKQDRPTNVLSFPASLEHAVSERGHKVLGDIAICAPIVFAEAEAQNKTITAHWAHMVVHGVLHLCGYDHVEEDEAKQMETLEQKLLKQWGFSDPYR